VCGWDPVSPVDSFLSILAFRLGGGLYLYGKWFTDVAVVMIRL
jgi:hypothetical protein